ncbi:NAD(P)-binding domain-containing protein [Bacillus sp. FJAT-42315]|uniref:NAD(P)-binding domain-containing protein n=1 Tax=Bacillus sp. FJAT-42315 TaxID=2014077 RepID=UPI000C24BDA2|nr:NAD(P)-binding domain-containing protein [Bacillus sp. FJAT-42315]
MMDWLIIGGGIQGCTLAIHLVRSGKVTPERLGILDRHEAPLMNWKMYTMRTGMDYLRSPQVHHLDYEPASLHTFARKQHKINQLVGYYKKPQLELFNEHSEVAIQSALSSATWIKGEVTDIKKESSLWQIETKEHQLKAKNVVLATGCTEQFAWPEWAAAWRKEAPKQVAHLFQKEGLDLLPGDAPIVIIGGGISAAHFACRLIRAGRKVIMISRHALRVHEFDSDPGWLGPKYMSGFLSVNDYAKRREMITTARRRGSLPPMLYRKLTKYMRQGLIQVLYDEVSSCEKLKHTMIQLKTKHGKRIRAAQIILATGFSSNLSTMDWLQTLIREEQLPTAACGYPVLTASLQWKEGLYAVGALAELELGPSARNISGARSACRRMIHHL